MQTLNIRAVGRSGEQNIWRWMKPLKNEDISHQVFPVLLAKQWETNEAFRAFCNSLILKHIQYHDQGDHVHNAIKFYCGIVVGGLARITDVTKQVGSFILKHMIP